MFGSALEESAFNGLVIGGTELWYGQKLHATLLIQQRAEDY